MSNQKKKDKKKKAREKAGKLKVRLKREAVRAKAKEEKLQEQKYEDDYEKSVGKQKPYRKPKNDEEAAEQEEHDADVLARLQQNIQILEALEQEYEKEQAARNELNATLEGEGFDTVKEKMDHLHKKALEHQGHDDEAVQKLTETKVNLGCTTEISPIENTVSDISENITDDD